MKPCATIVRVDAHALLGPVVRAGPCFDRSQLVVMTFNPRFIRVRHDR